MRTHYDNLHVSEKASPEVIKGAYKALTQKWHPDKNPEQREKAERYFKIITAAYEVLSDQKARAEYDAWLKQRRAEQARSQPVNEAPQHPPEPQQRSGDNTAKEQKAVDPARMVEAWEDGRRAGAAGAPADSCPYGNVFATAWMNGFEAGKAEYSPPPPQVYPWRRLYARLIDTLLISSACGFASGYFLAAAFNIDIERLFGDSIMPWVALSAAGVLVIETLLLYTTGTTPGKALFGIRVKGRSGENPDLNESFQRSFLANLWGQGALIPGLSLITYPANYFLLRKNGTAHWDREVGTTVVCSHLSTWRWSLCTAIALATMVANSVLWKAQMSDIAQKPHQDSSQSQVAQPSNSSLPSITIPQVRQPEPQPPSLTADELHFQRIYAVHPDTPEIVASAAFNQWSRQNSERLRITNSGTADEVIRMLSEYKASLRSRTQPAPLNSEAVDVILGNAPIQTECQFKAIMTSEDYRACGLTPPGRSAN